jgi:hypothetical protein
MKYIIRISVRQVSYIYICRNQLNVVNKRSTIFELHLHLHLQLA